MCWNRRLLIRGSSREAPKTNEETALPSHEFAFSRPNYYLGPAAKLRYPR